MGRRIHIYLVVFEYKFVVPKDYTLAVFEHRFVVHKDFSLVVFEHKFVVPKDYSRNIASWCQLICQFVVSKDHSCIIYF